MSHPDRTPDLIFLISQPRAGSTLLQRMLGGHPDIHTMSEPWIMLHPLFTRRQQGIAADYDATLAAKAVDAFVGSIPGGEATYLQSVRDFASGLYTQALDGTGKRYFLDKTPRYYFIIPELAHVFPKARFIILLRNPLAVMASILDTWVGQDLLGLSEFKFDLLRAPGSLLTGIDLLGDRAIVVRYEELVADPTKELRRISEHLGIKFVASIIEYGTGGLPQWGLGDPKTVYERARPDSQHAEKWISKLNQPQTWKLIHDYLHLLGPATCNQLGYSYDGLLATVEDLRPSGVGAHFLTSLESLIDDGASHRSETRKRQARHAGLHQVSAMKQTATTAMRRVARALPIGS